MSEFSDLQAEFNRLQAEFATWVHDLPDINGRTRRIRDGYAYRDTRCNAAVGGHRQSAHLNRLARDLVLDVFIGSDWVWQDQTEAYRELGTRWEGMHALARWGGHFQDGNHFSFEWQGVR